MPILNMNYTVSGGGGGNIGEPLNLTVTSSGTSATITWTDNEIGTIPPTTFAKSELVRKIGSAPTSPSDGTLVVTETVKDTYKNTGYVDSGLTDETTYYYRVFSYSDSGGISYCDAVSVTISAGWQPGVNTLVYLPLDGDANDYSGNSRNGTLPGSYSRGTLPNSKQCFSVSGQAMNFSSYCITGTYSDTALGSGDRTMSIWVKINSGINTSQVTTAFIGNGNGGTQGEWFGIWHMDHNSGLLGILRYYDDPYTNSFSYDNNWHNYIITYNSANKGKVYADGVQIIMTNNASVSFNTLGTTYAVGLGRSEGSKSIDFSNFILENKERTAGEISTYYNKTKGEFGIS